MDEKAPKPFTSAQNTGHRIIWIVDCSQSMELRLGMDYRVRMDLVNQIIQDQIHDISETYNKSKVQVNLRVLLFSTDARWMTENFIPIEQFEWSPIKSDGGITNLGESLHLLAQALKLQKDGGTMPEYGYPPKLILITDGYPTDDWEKGLSQLMNEFWGSHSIRMAIGLEGADKEILKQFVGNVPDFEKKLIMVPEQESLLKSNKIFSSFLLADPMKNKKNIPVSPNDISPYQELSVPSDHNSRINTEKVPSLDKRAISCSAPGYFHDVFISYIEKDSDTARDLAQGLETAGYKTWYYGRDSLPGLQYLRQVRQKIDATPIVMIIISPESLNSAQVYNEITYAHETGKSFLPILKKISHAEFQKRKPDWRMILGAYTSIQIPENGINDILQRIIEGTRELLRSPIDQGYIQSSELKEQNDPSQLRFDGLWKGSWKRENANIVHEGQLSIRQNGPEIYATMKVSFEKLGTTTILEEQMTGKVEESSIILKGKGYTYIEQGKSVSYLLDSFILQVDETGMKLFGEFKSKKGAGKAHFIRV
jgi:uncharacterized protein YegL